MTNIRLVLADDHPLFVQGLARILAEDSEIELVATATDGEEALAAIQQFRPEVALLDIMMPKRSGIQVLEAIQQEGLPTKILFITGSEVRDTIYTAFAAGAQGYLLKTQDWSDVVLAVKQVAAGETVIAAEMLGPLVRQVQTQAVAKPLLTNRERAILDLIKEGLTQQQIANKLYLARGTVRTHIGRIYAKLGVTTQASAVAEALRRGLI